MTLAVVTLAVMFELYKCGAQTFMRDFLFECVNQHMFINCFRRLKHISSEQKWHYVVISHSNSSFRTVWKLNCAVLHIYTFHATAWSINIVNKCLMGTEVRWILLAGLMLAAHGVRTPRHITVKQHSLNNGTSDTWLRNAAWMERLPAGWHSPECGLHLQSAHLHSLCWLITPHHPLSAARQSPFIHTDGGARK